ncbi:MAG: hypothetical protein AB7I41_20185 [Candidatus Sericytochromatia bacterium]
MEHPLSLNLIKHILIRALAVMVVFGLAFVLFTGVLPSPWPYPVGFLAFGIVLLAFRSVSRSSSTEWGKHPAHSSLPDQHNPK